jgi:FLVCR family feline leukemia virus subgroup C receptor-related protein
MLGMFVYTFTLNTGHISVVYFTSALLGFAMTGQLFIFSPHSPSLVKDNGFLIFLTGYLPVGFEFAAELTYPEPEGTSSGLLNAGVQVFGISFTILYSELLDSFGDIAANSVMAAFLIVGTIITAFIKSDLRRQNAHIPTTPSA